MKNPTKKSAAKAVKASPKSLGQVAYERLREALADGTLSPGDRISVNALAEAMALSRTPVREAISVLETEGLIVHEPGTGGRRVAELDHQMVNELTEVRIVLERAGVAMAAQNASQAEIEVLRELVEMEKAAMHDPARRARLNVRLHDAIHRCAHNRYLNRTLAALQSPMLLLGPAASDDSKRLRDAHAEHLALVDAIARRDALEAQEIITRHLIGGQRVRITRLLQSLSDED